MRKILAVLVALLTFIGAPLTAAAEAASPASAVRHWRHYGADPAYASKEAATADAANVFIRAGWPPEVARQMQARMQDTTPERIELRKGDRLDFMRSGPRGLWRDVLVDFVSPTNMNITAPADRWVLVVDGVTYEAILPDVCNNLAGRKSGEPQNPCVFAKIKARDADHHAQVALFGEFTAEELAACPPSWQGPGTGVDGSTFNPDGYQPIRDCEGRPCDWTSVQRAVELPLELSGSFLVSEGYFVVRVPRRVAETDELRLVFCLTDDEGRTTLGMGIHAAEYHEIADGVKLATIWQDQPSVRADYRDSTILWWRWTPESRQYAAN